MTTILTIPGAKAFHIPPTAAAHQLPLSEGDLNLVEIPMNPPSQPTPLLTLSVGTSTFPLKTDAPLQRVKAKQEHPTYIFRPVPKAGEAPVGQIIIKMKDSANQGEWDATEVLCQKFEDILKKNTLWDEKIHFVNDEYDTSGEPIKAWGESIASTLVGGASFLAAKISGLTDNHVQTATPVHPTIPTPETAGKASGVRNATAHMAVQAENAAVAFGDKVHQAGKDLGEKLPDGIARHAQPVPEGEKGEFRQLAEEGWQQATIAAKGLLAAAQTVGTSLSDNTHRAVEHNFGKESDRVAQDIGQAGANVVATGASVMKGTSVIMQGTNAVTGAASTAPK